MRRNRKISGPEGERGVVILLVAVFLLFVVGAMAVLAIDVVTFYSARSEAQLAADGAALAGARVMANSGATSDPVPLEALAQALATATALQVAGQNKVGGRLLNAAANCAQEVCVSFPPTVGLGYNPRVQVRVTRNDLPTFFARILGRTQVSVSGTATAEAYNPSGVSISLGAGGPIAPVCAKPWLLPNLDPRANGNPIFGPNGAIFDTTLLGQSWMMSAKCDSCVGSLGTATAGMYYPGAIDALDFPVPAQSLPIGSTGFNDYQLAVAGCVQKPIVCGALASSSINVDTNIYTPTGTDRNEDTANAASLLIHYKGAVGDTDSVDTISTPSPPFQFVGGNANPVVGAVGKNVLVSDSLVTVPVFNLVSAVTPVTSPVQVIGFLQLFLNPLGSAFPQAANQIQARVINMAGCGTTAAGQPILGTGASAIPVRLISSP